MEDNSDILEVPETSESSSMFKKKGSSLKLRLSRVLHSGNVKDLKSPSCVSWSSSLSPSDNSPSVKCRDSWQFSTSDIERLTYSSESGVSVSSQKSPTNINFVNSPRSGSFQNSCLPKWDIDERMKYSPQQQQKERKSESEVCSVDTTPKRVVRDQQSADSKNLASSSTRSRFCRSPSTGMFAWMRVFRLATMLHQVGC